MAEQELRAVITADDKQFQQTTKRSEKRGKNFANKMVQYGKMIAGALAVREIGRFIKGTVEATAQVGRMAERLGIGVEALQELNYAAKQYGVSQEAMQDGLKELTMRVDEFAKRGKGPAADVMKNLGFTREEAEQLKGNTEELFNAVIDKISEVGNTAERQRIADELFGGAGGEQLVEMVSDGTEALKEFRKEAQGLGIILSASEMVRMVEYDKQIKKISSSWQGFKRQVVVNVVPALGAISKGIQAITNPAVGIPKLINDIKGVKKETVDFKEIVEATEKIFEGFVKQVDDSEDKTGDQTKAFELGTSSIEDHWKELEKLDDQLKDLSPLQEDQIQNILDQKEAIEELLGSLGRAEDAWEGIEGPEIEGKVEPIEGVGAEAGVGKAIGEAAAEAEEANKAYSKFQDTVEDTGPRTEAEKFNASMRKNNAAIEALEDLYKRLKEGKISAAENDEFLQGLKELDQEVEDGKISVGEFVQGLEELRDVWSALGKGAEGEGQADRIAELEDMSGILETNKELMQEYLASLDEATDSEKRLNAAIKLFGDQVRFSARMGIDSMEDYGKAVANAARAAIAAYLAETVAAAVRNAVGTGPGGLILAPIAAGAAAITFNALVPEFAEGGAVTGPTMAMIGESPGISKSNPEYVGTADQISKMSGQKGYIAEASIDIDELRIAIREQDRYTQNTL